MTDERRVLRRDGVEVLVDASVGGRVGALRVDGLGLLVESAATPLGWGAYPMLPWAGRLDRGRLEWRGREYTFPIDMPPHAIHGTVDDQPWRVTTASHTVVELDIDLAPRWPFGGRAVHRVELAGDELHCRLEVHAGAEAMPAIVGWHPWFPRRLDRGGELTLDLRAAAMLRRGADGLPSGEVVPVPAGPWDDAFLGVSAPPRLRWPGAMALEIRAHAPVWVVYTQEPQAIAVEPQTGPPNGLDTGDFAVVTPGHPLVAEMTLAWWREGPAA